MAASVKERACLGGFNISQVRTPLHQIPALVPGMIPGIHEAGRGTSGKTIRGKMMVILRVGVDEMN